MELLFFLTAYLMLFSSVAGWGLITSKMFYSETFIFGKVIIYGIFALTLISYITSFLIPHGIVFNLILHSIGVLNFYLFKKKIKLDKYHILIILIIFTCLLISKNHDDFPFYHLQQSLNLSFNKLQIGLSNLDFSYAHHSSIFFLNSLFYIPHFKFYLFNSPNLILYSGIIIFMFDEIRLLVWEKDRNKLFCFYFLNFCLVFILSKFNRLSEFGTDLVTQCLIILFIYSLLSKEKIKENFFFIHIILLLCFSFKTYFVVYILFYFFLIYQIGIKEYLNKLLSKKFFLVFSFLFLSIFIVINFLSTSCLIYPFSFTCFDNFLWSMGSDQVKSYAIWYEKWAKGIAGTGYVLEDSINLLKNLSWVENWFSNYFRNKVLDVIGLLTLIAIIFFVTFKGFKNKNYYFSKNLSWLFIINFLIFLIWFYNHPTLRYGGYVPILIIFSFVTSYFLSSLDLKYISANNLIKSSNFVLILAFSVLITKNISRIYLEINREDIYKFLNFPYFYIPDVKYNEYLIGDDIKVKVSINNNCWSISPPCTTNLDNLKAIEKYNFVIFHK